MKLPIALVLAVSLTTSLVGCQTPAGSSDSRTDATPAEQAGLRPDVPVAEDGDESPGAPGAAADALDVPAGDPTNAEPSSVAAAPADRQTDAVQAGDTPDAAPALADAPADADADDDADETWPPTDLSDWFVGTGHQGLHTVAWRPVSRGKVPRNAEFEMDVLVLRDEQPQPDAQLQVTGWMPAHSHGLVQMPSVENLGAGRYRVVGMLLHMRGAWQVRFEIIANRSLETVTFELEL